MNALSRRNLLRTLPMGLAAVALPAVVETPLQAELTAIPSDVVDKILVWQRLNVEAILATHAYSVSLRVKPIDKAECDRLFQALCEANEKVPPAREAMIMALSRV